MYARACAHVYVRAQNFALGASNAAARVWEGVSPANPFLEELHARPPGSDAVKSSSSSSQGPRPRAVLTEREKQILRLLCDGLTNPQIAVRMDLSTDVVKSSLKRIFRKIDAKDRKQAAMLAMHHHRGEASGRQRAAMR
jgi:DNA-binding CsgD family transcriptional regulator